MEMDSERVRGTEGVRGREIERERDLTFVIKN